MTNRSISAKREVSTLGINKLQSSQGTPGSWGQAGSSSPTDGAEPSPGGQPAPPFQGPRPPAWLETKPVLWVPKQGSRLAPGSTERGQTPEAHPASPLHPAAAVQSSPCSPATRPYPASMGQHLPTPRQGRGKNSPAAAFKCSEPSAAGDDAHPHPHSHPHPRWPQPGAQQQPQLCPSFSKSVPKPCPLAVPGTETTDPQWLRLKSFISCSRSGGGRLGGAGDWRRGSSARHPDGETRDPLSLPTAPSPLVVLPMGAPGTGSAICTVTQEPVSRTLAGTPRCHGTGGRGARPRATPARAAGTERGRMGPMAEPPFLREMQRAKRSDG